MSPADTLDFARQSIYVLLQIITPAMLTALVVGLAIGLLQALTQIQEMTLVFVPKIIAIFVVLLIALPALSGLILTYLLVFARTGAMVMLLPGIGDTTVPSRVRLVLGLAIA